VTRVFDGADLWTLWRLWMARDLLLGHQENRSTCRTRRASVPCLICILAPPVDSL